MNATLIIDDLFLQDAYERFLRVYTPIHGDKVKGPLSFPALSGAVAARLGREIAATHVFYLQDRPSTFISRLVRRILHVPGADGSPPPAAGIPKHLAIEFHLDDLGLDMPSLLAQSAEAVFHSCEFLAMEAAEFAQQCEGPVILADDPAYEMARGCSGLIFIRLGNHETRMPPEVRWLDASYIFCKAYGVAA